LNAYRLAGTVSFAHWEFTCLELGLGRYQAALESALAIYEDDLLATGAWVLPNLIEAAVRSGNHDAALAALKRMTERATASGTPLALGFLARSQALLATDAEAEPLYNESIDRLRGSPTKPELARSHLLLGGMAAPAGTATRRARSAPDGT
jgi:hypothetical protein